MKLHWAILFLLSVLPVAAPAQSLSGLWSGYSTQEGVSGRFYYEVEWLHQGDQLRGSAISRSPDGQQSARFQIAGTVLGSEVTWQEFEQISPAHPRWCLKMARLRLSAQTDSLILEGAWTADNCRPGHIRIAIDKHSTTSFSLPGQWTGHLSQSDRPYGFFYQLELLPNGTGTAYIVSESSGGSATHQLVWTDSAGLVTITESAVIDRTVAKWKWCIKTMKLQLRQAPLHWTLEGNWTGFIEGNSTAKGVCAPGTVFIEKPVLPDTIAALSNVQSEQYVSEQGRKIQVNQIVEVARPEIRIQVWDNGVADGDVATLFLNGKKILGRYRVNKSRYSIPVKLLADNNILVLHAESLGSVPPNTIAVSVFDGVKEQTIVLCSNLQESGAVLIRTFQVK